MERTNCNLCGANDEELIYIFELGNSQQVRLVSCRCCGLKYLNPRPNKSEIQKYYEHDYYSYKQLTCAQAGKLNFFEKLRAYIRETTFKYYYGDKNQIGIFGTFIAKAGAKRFISAPKDIQKGSILDVGCGDGLFLSPLKDYGWQVYGTELSELVARRARRGGINMRCGELTDLKYEANFFEIVRMLSVLEHTYDPMAYLREAGRVLKPKGYLILEVPNFDSIAKRVFKKDWVGLDIPRHLYHFQPKTLKEMLKKSGFNVDRIFYKSVGTFASSFNQPKILNLLISLTLPLDAITDLLSAGDCIVVFAKKVGKD
jgi:2-polyprenyl-3-methyl-5-hydroxy-6-metoxy-1,4-benzoquinol methylase